MFGNDAAARLAQQGLSRQARLRRERWTASFDAERDAILAAAETAHLIHDHETMVAAADAMEANGPLDPTLAMRRARALVALERLDEALAAIEALCGRWRSAKTIYQKAVTLAVAGRVGEAAAALDEAMALGPTPEEGLREVIAVMADPGEGWTDLKRKFDALRWRGWRVTERALAAQAIDHLPPWRDDEAEAALAIAGFMLELTPPEQAAPLLDRLVAEGAPAERLASLLAQGKAEAQEAAGDRRGAIATLGELAKDDGGSQAVRHALARNIGRAVLRAAPLRLTPSAGRRKVINVMPFYDEFTMLDLRLAEMGPWVDHFVLIEARSTFTGLPKSLHFQENQARYAAYADRITCLTLDEFPAQLDTAWARDFYQRDCAAAALSGLAAEDDLVLITDADELVRRAAVEDFDGDIARLDMRRYMYFLNLRPAAEGAKRRLGPTGVAVRARHLAEHGASYLRFMYSRYPKVCPFLRDAGWHFTSAKPVADLVIKYEAYAHQERDRLVKDEGYLTGALAEARAGVFPEGWEACAIDESYPDCIRARPPELADLIL